jgi:DNA polymerase-3 subunit alpha
MHAAGIVLCGQPLNDVLPTIHLDDKTIVQYEMDYLEPLGLIKMDLLGLSNLTIIKQVVDLVKERRNYEINLNHIELNNANVLNQLSSGDTVGIFQLESSGMTTLIKKLRPKTIEDLSMVLALYRPGPMQNINIFLANKKEPEKIEYINPLFKKYLASTYGVIVYQEQMMEIIKGVCNYSFAKADIFRRIISKKKSEQLQELKTEFIADAIKNGYSEPDAQKTFQYIESFADYGFNHSHSLSYAYIAY